MQPNKYAPQVATHRRTQEAILQGTKKLIVISGLRNFSMIQVASISEVSRATLYNHYRDKTSLLRALCESEIGELVQLMQSCSTAAIALEQISIKVSSDSALATLRGTDCGALASALISHEDLLWRAFSIAMGHLLPEPARASLAIGWLIGQTLNPITPEQSLLQAKIISDNADL